MFLSKALINDKYVHNSSVNLFLNLWRNFIKNLLKIRSKISSAFIYLSNYMLFARLYHISKHYFQAGREIKLEIIYITEHVIYNPIYIPYQLHMTISLWMDQFSFLMNISSGLDRQKFEWIIITFKCHITKNSNEKNWGQFENFIISNIFRTFWPVRHMKLIIIMEWFYKYIFHI